MARRRRDRCSAPRSASSRPRSSACSPHERRDRAHRGDARSRATSSSCAWSATAPPTTQPRTASTRSACCRAGRRCATRSRSPCTTTRRSTSPGSMVIGLSQSGQTPDVVEYLLRARAGGRLHGRDHERRRLRPRRRSRGDDPARRRPGARRRGDEDLRQHARRARAARGTHRRAGGGDRGRDPRRGASSSTTRCRRSSGRRAPLALPFAYTGRMFVIGRGIEFATAREIALKLLETCRIAAEPLTATDLAHGPVAALDPLFPVWAIASADGTLADRAGGGRRASTRWVRRSSRAAPPRAARHGQLVPAPGSSDRAGAALAAALGRARPALRAGALPAPAASTPTRRTGSTRSRSSPETGYPVGGRSRPRAGPRAGARSTRSPSGRRRARCRPDR